MRPAIGWAAPCQAAATDCVTVIIMFRTVRHMPNDTTGPNLITLCHQYQLNVLIVDVCGPSGRDLRPGSLGHVWLASWG